MKKLKHLNHTLVANTIGRTTRTLYLWDQNGVYTAEKAPRREGGRLYRCYTELDLPRLRKIAATRKPGRPRKARA